MHKSSMPGPFPFPCSDGSPAGARPACWSSPGNGTAPNSGLYTLSSLASLFTFIALFLIQHSPHFSQNESKLEVLKGVLLHFVMVSFASSEYIMSQFSVPSTPLLSPCGGPFLKTYILCLLNPALFLALTLFNYHLYFLAFV